MGRDENREVFQDTERLVKTNEKLKKSVEHSIAAQEVILERETLSVASIVL